MKLTVQTQLHTKKPKTKSSSHLVVLVDKSLNIIGNIDNDEDARIKALIKASRFTGALAESTTNLSILDKNNSSLTLIGIGDTSSLNANLDKIAHAIFDAVKTQDEATVLLDDSLDATAFSRLALSVLNASYRFDKYKSTKNKSSKDALKALTFICNQEPLTNYKSALQFAHSVYAGQSLARNLANEPPNVCTPEYLAKEAKRLAKAYPDLLTLTVLDGKKMDKLGMNCLLAVAKGSENDARLIVLEYHGAGKSAPIALVGKGVTFDTGGISLKPGAGMDEMKFDMGGAASVLGTIQALCEARLAINVVAVCGCVENSPSGSAYRPGDILTAMNGTTVEVLNTDAEGRLVLADALCYVQSNYKPKAIIDVATLTGACVIALGSIRSGLYSNDEDTLFALQAASEESGDLAWHMPLDDAYQEQINAKCADIQNIGKAREAGSVIAACFLSRFIKEGQAWAHLDVAGTAWKTGSSNSATGRPVPLFMHYLKAQAHK